jgi:molybdopterin synthase sulfur carrier subunit
VTVTIRLPGALRTYCDGASELLASVSNVRAALEHIERSYPSLYLCICDETGAVRRHINVWINNSHMREQDGLDTVLVDGDAVTILPAVSGG